MSQNIKRSVSISFCLAVLLSAITLQPAEGQLRDRFPSINYYQGFFDYYDADYRDAGKQFLSSSRSALQFGNQFFLDSVCYWTMMGECHYRMGNYSQAIEQYERALGLYVDYINEVDWQARVKMPPQITPNTAAVQQANISWGTPRRKFTVASLPDSVQFMFGEVGGAQKAFQFGGVAQEAEFRRVDVGEVMRCAAIALHRRRVIKGATCKYDPFTGHVHQALTSYGGGAGNLLSAWNGVLLGISQSCMGKTDAAQRMLAASLQFNGNMDHNLTPIALLELAELRRASGDHDGSVNMALEASYSAAIFNQFDVLADSIDLAAQSHLVKNRSVLPALEPMINWATRSDARLASAVATVRLADCFVEMGEADLSVKAITQTARTLSRKDLKLTSLGPRTAYLQAATEYMTGNFAAGRTTLIGALGDYARTSRWLYQLNLADELAIAGTITELQADQLYTALLRDPTFEEWKTDPIEAMSFLASDHLGAMERWFEIVVARKDFDRALQISELLKRHRFFASLPMGGRLLAFRWMMEGPDELLTKSIKQQKTEFDARFPAYKTLSQGAEKIRTQLLTMPLKSDDEDATKTQTDLFVSLQTAARNQESMLASVALRRQAADFAFPPTYEPSDLMERMGPDEIAFIVTGTQSTTYLFGQTKQGSDLIGFFKNQDVSRAISKLHRELQTLERQVDIEELGKPEKWQKTAQEIADVFFTQVNQADWDKFKSVTIVPDGATWYLPWEVLMVGPDQDKKMIAERSKIRYSPTLGLAFANKLPFHRMSRSAVMAGKMHQKADPAQSVAAAQELEKLVPNLAVYEERVFVPSNLLGAVADRFVVYSTISRPAKGGIIGTYAASPIELDLGRNGSNLASWLSLPYRSVDQIWIPGFISDGGGGKARTGGNDMFLMTTSLLASGVRTVGISRWNSGGKSALDLSNDFVKRNGNKDAVSAWNETINNAKTIAINLDEEQRFKPDKNAAPLTAEHPFFWSGMIVVDSPAAQAGDLDANAGQNQVGGVNNPAVNKPKPNQPGMNKQPPADGPVIIRPNRKPEKEGDEEALPGEKKDEGKKEVEGKDEIDRALNKVMEENSEEKAKKAVEKNATENKKEEGGGN